MVCESRAGEGRMPGLKNQSGLSLQTNNMISHIRTDMHVPSYHSWGKEQSADIQKPAPVQQRKVLPRPSPWLQQQRGSNEDLKANLLGTKPWVNNNGNHNVGAPATPGGAAASNQSDDLQSMVLDFMENDSVEHMEGVETEAGSPCMKLSEKLQMLTTPYSAIEREILTAVRFLLLNVNENTHQICGPEGSDCKGGCTKRFVVKRLKAAGYSASVCKTKWPTSGRVPGGDYEFIDVVFNGDQLVDRLVVDIDFQSQFEIARPTAQYEAALRAIPTVYVGTVSKLEKILELMSEEAKVSLKQNGMHLPPWRTLGYMTAKWLSKSVRKSNPLARSPFKGPCSLHWQEKMSGFLQEASPHDDQFRHTKLSLLAT